ncbi:MAG: tyrosine--tRNA ligase [Candidatus Liptonbacteria bacterium]|nr:tyrosine--tRNA ligase [Candidatus Liptonbacteria bacterium]
MFGKKEKQNIEISPAAVDEALGRSIDKIYPSKDALREAILSGRRLKIYLGVDPTGQHLHLGQLTNLLVLKKLQDLGQEIILLIGDFTAQIGDPTDKFATRRPLTKDEVKANAKTFKEQVGRIIRFDGPNPAKIDFNSRWLEKMNLADWMKLSSYVTEQQKIARDMFQERLKEKKPIALHEFAYPLLQGYDSVALGVDMEIGGTDQTFNMLMGRHLAKIYNNKEKFVLTTKLLENPKTGKKLMNKSEGGMVNLDDRPEEMFGKVMSLDDVAMFSVAEFSTEMPMARIDVLKKEVASAEMNPRDAKAEIAEAVVTVIYGEKAAHEAREKFKKMFFDKEMPVDAPFLDATHGTTTMLVRASRAAVSNSEARRLIEQGALEIGGKVIKNPNLQLEKLGLKGGEIVKIGKKRFFRAKI